MLVERLWLQNWRSWHSVCFEPSANGVTVLLGENGHGKTNVLEAISWAATMESFRGAPKESLINSNSDTAVVRLEALWSARRVTVEGELSKIGRSRILINKQPLKRRSDLFSAFRVSVFSPDDLVLVKGSPQERRSFLDEAITSLNPRFDTLRLDMERVLRQRSMLLRQASGRLTSDVASTLDVWDAQFARIGEEVATQREMVVETLLPNIRSAYNHLAQGSQLPALAYQRSWTGSLEKALLETRNDDVKRARTGVGPHRDELDIVMGSLTCRSHASQGEQRSIALALRLAVHKTISERLGTAPVLILDDVFSELDELRAAALLSFAPAGQVIVASAGPLPESVKSSQIIDVDKMGLHRRQGWQGRSA